MDRLSEPADATAELSFGAPSGGGGAVDAPPTSTVVAGSGHDRPPTGLTRVAIDVDRIVDEQSASWCRHEVRRIVAWHLVGTAAIAFAILVPLMWWAIGDPLLAVLIALVGAGLLAAARLGFAIVAAPLGYRYVQRFSDAPPEYLLAHPSIVEPAGAARIDPAAAAAESFPPPVPSPAGLPGLAPPAPPAPAFAPPGTEPADVWDLDPSDLPPDATAPDATAPGPTDDPDAATAITTQLVAVTLDAVSGRLIDLDGAPVPERHTGTADVLRELGFAPVATLRTEGLGGRYIDLYGDRDRIVVAVDRTSATTTVLTELAGFRVLVTSALLVPPTDELVVNVVADGDPAGLVLSHQRLVQQAFRSRTRVSEPVGLFKLAQQRELEAYRELGPLWGSVLDLRCRPRGVRLLAAPSAGDVLLFTGNRLFRQTGRERAS